MLIGCITVAALVFAVVNGVCTGAFESIAWMWVLPASFAGGWLALLLLAFVVLVIVCGVVKLDRPQEHDSRFYRQIMYLYIDVLIFLVRLRLTVRGTENTPRDGRFLLVCNHQNVADPGVLLHAFRKSQLAFISKKENMALPFINKFMHKIMCQMLDRENDRQALKVILKCIQLIKDDEVSIGVFPEGATSKDGKLHHFRSGVFKIAQKANVPIVVCTIRGTGALFHNLARLKTTDVELHLAGVIPAEELKGRTAVEIGDRVYRMMIDDLGPDFLPAEQST